MARVPGHHTRLWRPIANPCVNHYCGLATMDLATIVLATMGITTTGINGKITFCGLVG